MTNEGIQNNDVITEIEHLLKQAESNEEANIEVGRLFPDDAPPYKATLPQGYVISPAGTFRIVKDEDQNQLKKISRTPFFVAARSDCGKALIVRYVKKYWLRDWVRVSKISKSTFADLNITQEVDAKADDLITYAFHGLNKAPVKTSDTTILEAVQEVKDKLLESATYPTEIPIPHIRAICDEIEVSYNQVRTWLEQRGFIDFNSRVKRDEEKKPVRYLVFLKEVEIREGGKGTCL